MAFVHSRNVYFEQIGHEVHVLSFAAERDYDWHGVQVRTTESLTKEQIGQFDVCYIHAPNLRNCLRFIFKNRRVLRRVCLVIHGHEFLAWQKYVPNDFPFMRSKKSQAKYLAQTIYDAIKLPIWKFILRLPVGRELGVVFVSQWMKNHAEKDLRLSFDKYQIPNKIIFNPIHPAFESAVYSSPATPDADFVTIRSLDHPKYAIDVVVELAVRNPQYTFHVYGEGDYFKHYPTPPNMTVYYAKFRQNELPALLSRYRCALLPTRVDAQGVMMCEIASLGMPILVSDLEVCREMVGEFPNAGFFSNENPVLPANLPQACERPPRQKFFHVNTVACEIDFAASLPVLGSYPVGDVALSVPLVASQASGQISEPVRTYDASQLVGPT